MKKDGQHATMWAILAAGFAAQSLNAQTTAQIADKADAMMDEYERRHLASEKKNPNCNIPHDGPCNVACGY